MRQRCPKCGQWCEAEKDGFFKKLGRGYVKSIDSGHQFGSNIGQLFGKKGKKMGGSIMSVVSATTEAPLEAATESIWGSDYKFQCSECGYEWEADDGEDQTKEYEEEQAEYEYEQQHAQDVIDLREQSLQLTSYSTDEVSRFEERLWSVITDDDPDGYRAPAYNYLAYVRYRNGDTNGALDAINKSIQLCDSPDAHATKGVIMGEGRNAFDKYKALQELVKYKEDDGIPYWATEQQMDRIMDERSLAYAEEFLNIPYRQRKFIIISDKDFVMLPDNLKVVPDKYLPSEMLFPEGHPVVGEVYICHPYKENFYLPLETYQIELFRDEMRELRRILQCYWAKSIEIKDNNSTEENEAGTRNMAGHVNGEYKGVGGGVSGSNSKEYEKYQKEINDCFVEQEFKQMKEKPHIPNDVVWYPHRAAWQDLIKQLDKGNLSSHNITVNTSDSSQISSREGSSLEVEVKALIAAGGIGGNYDTSTMFKSETNKSWTLKVEFYPYEEENQVVPAAPTQLLSNQQMGTPNKLKYLIYGLIALVVLLGIIITLLLI
jgi:hypothetical protein